MRAAALSFLLLAGLCCMFACLGGDKEEPKEEVPVPPPVVKKEVIVDPRHQQRAQEEDDDEENLAENTEPAIDLEEEVRGTKPGARGAAINFVKEYVRKTSKVKADFNPPESLLTYSSQDHEWRIFGVLKTKNGRKGGELECFVRLNRAGEWECWRIKYRGNRVYDKTLFRNVVDLPNVRTSANGRVISGRRKPARDRQPEEEVEKPEPTEEDVEKKATGKLRSAKSMLKLNEEKGRKKLEELLNDFPDTKAAEEARELLDK